METRGERQVEQKLVGLLVRRLAVVARDDDVDIVEAQGVLVIWCNALSDPFRDDHRVGAGPLCERQQSPPAPHLRSVPSARFTEMPCTTDRAACRRRPHGDVAHVDGPPSRAVSISRPISGMPWQRLPGSDGNKPIAVADASRHCQPGTTGWRLAPSCELVQRDAVERQLLRIGLDADLIRASADDVGQADIRELGELHHQVFGQVIERIVAIAFGRRRLSAAASASRWRRRRCRARRSAARDAGRNAVEVGADLLVDAQDRVVRRACRRGTAQ